MFFIQKLVYNNIFKNNHIIAGMSCRSSVSKIPTEFSLTQFPTSQLGLISRAELILKSSSKSR